MNFRLGKARTTVKGGGGSGEPTTREVVQGVRPGLPGGADGTNRAARVVTDTTDNTARATKNRRRPGKGDRMNSAPEGAALGWAHGGAGRAECPL